MKKAINSRSAPQSVSAIRRTKIDTSDIPEVRDFSKGVRGRFYTGGKTVLIPIFVEEDVMNFLRTRASARRSSPSELANEMLRRDISLVESLTP